MHSVWGSDWWNQRVSPDKRQVEIYLLLCVFTIKAHLARISIYSPKKAQWHCSLGIWLSLNSWLRLKFAILVFSPFRKRQKEWLSEVVWHSCRKKRLAQNSGNIFISITGGLHQDYISWFWKDHNILYIGKDFWTDLFPTKNNQNCHICCHIAGYSPSPSLFQEMTCCQSVRGLWNPLWLKISRPSVCFVGGPTEMLHFIGLIWGLFSEKQWSCARKTKTCWMWPAYKWGAQDCWTWWLICSLFTVIHFQSAGLTSFHLKATSLQMHAISELVLKWILQYWLHF